MDTEKKWTKQEIKALAERTKLVVVFTKLDGTERHMFCTLQEEELPQFGAAELIEPAKGHDDLLAVWDLEKNAWRSFKISSVLEIIDVENEAVE